MVSIELQTKSYIKAYLLAQLGQKPLMNTRTNIGCRFQSLLQRQGRQHQVFITAKNYNTTIKVFISKHVYHSRGCYLNEEDVRAFNAFVEQEVKNTFRVYMDLFVMIQPSFEKNLPKVRKLIGIDADQWADDSIRKDYYRYRLEAGLPLLYKKPGSRVRKHITVKD